MAKYGKWIAGGLGWALGGPLGGLAGFALGSLFDSADTDAARQATGGARVRGNTRPGDFGVSLLVLSAAVMKADGKVMRSELDYVKKFFNQQFGEDQTRQLMPVLQDVLKKEIPLREICEQIRMQMHYDMRVQLVHYLFGIARADGNVAAVEVEMIKTIASYLRINKMDFSSVEAMFYKDTASAYKVLEVDAKATDDEVKKAYRRMAVRFHPDKVAALGEEFQKNAKEKFQKVQEAYDAIKKERGIS